MDPASIAGIVSAAGAIVKSIAGTIKSLNDIRGKFDNADLTIRLLISELSTIKSALNQIHDWAEFNLTEAQARTLGDNLDTTLDGCSLAMEILALDVADLIGIDSLDNRGRPVHLGFWERSSLVWNQEAVKDHQDRLSRQTAAMQLLLMAIQCRSISEQSELLRNPENVQTIRKIADDTSTIRATRSQVGSTVAPSIKSHDDSTISARVFPWDDQLVNAEAYRRVLDHHRSRSEVVGSNGMTRLEVPGREADNDEGYSSKSGTTVESNPSPDHLSPVWPRDSRRPPVRPYENISSDPDAIYRSRSLHSPVVPFMSESNLHFSRHQPDPPRTVGKKKSFWSNVSSLRRRSDLTSPVESLGARPGSRSPRGSRRGKRGLENNFHTSIDFASPDGMNCPQIVRAAQAGSIVEVESLLDNMVDIEACHVSSGRNAMAVAAHCGNDEIVELLLRYRAKLNRRDASGSTPMHLAASRGHLGVMNVLLNEQVPIEEKGPADKTPLRLSCDKGEFEAAELLLSKRAKVNARDKDNLTSLHAASKRGDVDIVDLLIKYGAHIEAKDGQFMAALHYASEAGKEAVVDLLLDRKADIEAAGRDGKTPLISAASEGHVHILELLLRRKASMKKRSGGEMSALHWAAFNGHVEAVDALLLRKAPINVANADGRTALHLAVMAEKFDVVELLLRKNATVEAPCRSAFRPLHYACNASNIDIVRLLLHSGANAEAEALDRRRPLHLAAKQGVIPTVTMLVEHGCNMEVRDAAGDRPLLLASAAGHTEVVRKLLDSGAPLRSKFAAGPSHEDSPLCVAARNGHLEVVTLLINRGTSVRHKDEYDWHPLRYAAHYGHPEIVDRLLLYGASVTGNQGWGFGLTAERIGFAENIYIPEERREEVLRLLREAEERERVSQERVAATGQYISPAIRQATIPQSEASELDHGMDIQRPPPRELFSPDNTRYSQPGQEAHMAQQPSRPSNGQRYWAEAEAPILGRSDGVSQSAYRRFSFQPDSQDRSQSTVSALSPEDSRGHSAVSVISPGPTPEPSVSTSSTPRPFSYVPTPVSSTGTPISSETGQETPNPATTYRDTLRAWSSTIPPLPQRAPVAPPASSNQDDVSERRLPPTSPVNPRTETSIVSLPPRPVTPAPSLPPRNPPPSPPMADTISVETLDSKVKRRRELGLTTFSAPGDVVWDLTDLEMMLEGYRAAGIRVLGRAQDGFPPHEGLEGGEGTGLEPARGGSDRIPRGLQGSSAGIGTPVGPPTNGADFLGTGGVDRFARSPAGVFEIG